VEEEISSGEEEVEESEEEKPKKRMMRSPRVPKKKPKLDVRRKAKLDDKTDEYVESCYLYHCDESSTN